MRFVFFLFFSALAMAGEYTTYIGDMYPRTVTAITADSSGNTYVVGNRASAVSLQTVAVASGPIIVPSLTPTPPNDVFVTKIDPSGNVLFSRSFAGKGADYAYAVAVDPSGNIYVAGVTSSPDFPISNALQPQMSPYGSAFIVKLSPDGKAILYSTYFGGLQGSTAVLAIATDASGNLYLTGSTAAPDFPVTAGTPPGGQLQGLGPSSVAFVTAISTAGDKILFSRTVGEFANLPCVTVFGCPATTTGIAVALDGAGNVYFGGNTDSVVATTPGAFVSTGLGAFVGKIAANGYGMAYLTYLDSAIQPVSVPQTGASTLSSLAVDSVGNAYLAGLTYNPKFPVTLGVYQPTFAGYGYPNNPDGFLAKLNPDGSGLVWATYFGSSTYINSIAVDAAGDIWATGTTASPSFPNAQGWSQGGDFLVEMNPYGSALIYSARYPDLTVAQAVALDPTLLIHTTGRAGIVSAIASTAPPSAKIFGIDNVIGAPLAGRISPAEVISIYGPNLGPATAITAVPASGKYPTTLSGIQVKIGGIAAPLLYVSSTQIHAVVPMGVTPGAPATVQITNGSTITQGYPVWIDASDVESFPVLNQDGSLNSATNPAKSNATVIVYMTGWQTNFSPLTDGEVAMQANNSACSSVICSATGSTITYAGAAPGLVAGVTQINLLLNGSFPVVGPTNLPMVVIEGPIFITGPDIFVPVFITQ